MHRMLLPLAALAAVLVVPTRAAAADECACGAPTVVAPFGGWEALLESTDPELLMERAIDPAELETPDPHAVRGVAPRSGEHAPQVLWCMSADDPRCSPLTPDDAPQPRTVPSAAPALPPTLTRVAGVRWLATSRVPVARPARTQDTGSSHTSRLERPPRA